MVEFVHLHNHTEYSVLDGGTSISKLMKKMKEYKMPAVAITDHGNMYGCAQFFLEAQKYNIKPIIGCETYLAPSNRFDRSMKGRDAYYHQLLLVKNNEGYRNLMELVSLGFIEGFYYKPRIDRGLLKQHSKGLIGTTSCLKGIIPQHILKGKLDKAREVTEEFISYFDTGDFYIELMYHGIPEQQQVNEELIKISKEFDLPIIATNDCHYLCKEDAYPHEVLLCIQTGFTLSDPKRMRFSSQEFYVKQADEMEQLFGHIPNALKNTLEIAEKCDVNLGFGQRLLPRFNLPPNYTNEGYLIHLCQQGMQRHYPNATDIITQRLEYELSIIKSMGFIDYFLIVWDFINYARSQHIPVGPGRGSAAGSIVAYLLGITNIDPLRYDLIFERFLNPERVSMPDIDIDFCYERRGEVINYVTNKYGKSNVAQIVTFGTLGAKAVIRDVGRVMGMEYNEVDRIAKLIPTELKMTLNKALKINPELKTLYDSDHQIHSLIDTASTLEGNVRNTSTHAAGIVISEKPLTNYVPLCKSANSEVATQYSMKLVEKLGLLKMDFLGLKTLTVIDNTVKNIQHSHNISVDLDNLPMNDSKTYQLLSDGKAIGLFQLESSGMREILIKLKPTCFEDIIALVALYRPGPLGSGMVDDFINRKHGKTSITYELAQLEPILKDTYGIILYQEQVQKIASVLAGFTLGEADILRRAMGKKIAEEMDQQRIRFMKGAIERNIPKEKAKKIFDLMAKFAEYGFNKSHSAAYALISYQTAYFKANYPVEFMAALLSSEMTNPDKLSLYLDECKQMEIKILPPDVNQSFSTFTVIDNTIRFGLNAIKNVGVSAVESIIKARHTKDLFTSLYDFCKKVDPRQVNKKVIESLVRCGAFDSISRNRAQLFDAIEQTIDRASSAQADEAAGQFSLFGAEEDQPAVFSDDDVLPDMEDWSVPRRLQAEKELLGFYVTGHPLDEYKSIFERFNFQPIGKLTLLSSATTVNVAGIFSKVKITFTKRSNEKMAVTHLEDFFNGVDVLVYPKIFARCSDHIFEDNSVSIHGNLEINEGTPKIIANDIIPLKNIYAKKVTALTINLPVEKIQHTHIEKLKAIFSRFPGRCPICFNVNFPNQFSVLLQADNSHSILPNELLLSEIEHICKDSSVTIKM